MKKRKGKCSKKTAVRGNQCAGEKSGLKSDLMKLSCAVCTFSGSCASNKWMATVSVTTDILNWESDRRTLVGKPGLAGGQVVGFSLTQTSNAPLAAPAKVCHGSLQTTQSWRKKRERGREADYFFPIPTPLPANCGPAPALCTASACCWLRFLFFVK